MEFKDQLNRTINLPKTPGRIVSLVPSQTELLVDLGLRKNIVGITKFCVRPKDLKNDIKVVGGTKKVHFDKIKSLNPDIIICNKEENTQEIVEGLEKIAPVWVSDISTVEESFVMIEALGKIFKVTEKASKIISEIISEKEYFQVFMERKPVQKAVYLIWKKPYMAVGKNTFIDAMLKLNNFENVIIESRYPKVSEADFIKADIILLSTEPFPFKEKDVESLKNSFGNDAKLVDGEYFSWYGSRLIEAFKYFKTLH